MPLVESCASCTWGAVLQVEVRDSGVRTRVMMMMRIVVMAVAR